MNNLQNILQTRCTFYAFLARIFRTEADQQLLEALNGISFPEKSGDPVLDAGYAALTRWKTASGSDPLTELAVDYARVFLWPAKTQLIRMNRFTRVLRDL